METLAFNLCLLIFLLSMNELESGKGDNQTIAILRKMKNWGKEVKQNYLPGALKNTKQFIVVAIFSNKTLKSKEKFNLETGCPEKKVNIYTYQCKTSAVIFNEDLQKNDERFKKIEKAKIPGIMGSKWHGEIILIHGGILETLISNFRNDVGGKETCQVYLYSFNIPCAKINNTPYSCSLEIMKYNKGIKECRIAVVGYTRVYNMFKDSKTDEVQAKEWLLEAPVELFDINKNIRIIHVPEVENKYEEIKMLRQDKRRKRRASSELKMNADDMIFQDLVYTCLKNTPLPFCCLSGPTDTMRRQKILSFFVNSMSHYCTHNSTGVGSITSYSLIGFKRCFSFWLQSNIGSDCRICSDGSLESAWYQQYLIAFCIDGIMDWTTTFGRPSDGWDLTIPAWVSWNGPWNKMYLESVHDFQHRINLFCENKMLDIGSMCTKMSAKTIKNQSMTNPLIDKYLWP